MKSLQLILLTTGLVSVLSSCGQSMQEDMGRRLEQAGDLEAAIAEYRKGVEAQPNSGNLRFLLGQALFKSNKNSEAVKELREAARLDLKNIDAHVVLGQAELKEGNKDEAKTEFDVALVFEPKRV